MTENTITNWPQVRITRDGKFSYSLNVCNSLHIEDGFYDAEMAAHGLDEAKYHLIQSGHMRRCNYYFFPEEIAKWEAGIEFPPGPSEKLRRFMAAHQPRYPTLAERKAEHKAPSSQRVKGLLPSAPKLFAIYKGLHDVLVATPDRLTAEERAAAVLLAPKILSLAQ